LRTFRQKYYDLFSPAYDRFVACHSSDRSGNLRKLLASKTGVCEGDKVLDICTGTGSLLLNLQERVGTKGIVVGLDFSWGMLRQAKAKTRDAGKVLLLKADAGFLPFKPGAFDAVTCSHAFYELKGETQDNCLQEIVRILVPGSVFIMMEHDIPENPIVRFFFYVRLLSMGMQKAIEILRGEKNLLGRYFKQVEKIKTPNGRSKMMVCKT
jgi:ubiquinone/menaquinone biosynthesis C-methylase UbiE